MVFPKVLGKVATILTKINKEAPFPIPLSVINSEIHMTKSEPAVNAKDVWTIKTGPLSRSVGTE